MATYCPNQSCNHKLKLSDWRQNCPECNANILYYHMEERLDNEADHVELASAATRKWMNRAKAAMLGSPLSKFRFSLLIGGPLFLPAIPMGVWAVWSLIAEGDFMENFMPSILRHIDLDNPDLLLNNPWLALMVIGLVVAFPLVWLAGLIAMAFGCGPKWFGRNLLISGIGFAGACLAMVGLLMFSTVQPLSLRQQGPQRMDVILAQPPAEESAGGLLRASSAVIALRQNNMIAYEIVMTNNSAETLEGLTFSEVVPEGMAVAEGSVGLRKTVPAEDGEGVRSVAVDFEHSYEEDGFMWTIAEIEAGATATVTFRAVNEAGPLVEGSVHARTTAMPLRPGNDITYEVEFANVDMPSLEGAQLQLAFEGINVEEITWELAAMPPALDGGVMFGFVATSTERAVAQGFVLFALAGLVLAYLLLLGVNLVIKKRGGIPVDYTPCWIAFTPEDEIYNFIKETGGTVKDFRRKKAEETGGDLPPRRLAEAGETACVACGEKVVEPEFDQCEYCRNHAIALEKLEKQKRRIAEIERKNTPRAQRHRLQTDE